MDLPACSRAPRSQALQAFAEVYRFGPHHHPDRTRRTDHGFGLQRPHDRRNPANVKEPGEVFPAPEHVIHGCFRTLGSAREGFSLAQQAGVVPNVPPPWLTMITTCRLNDIDPKAWLADVLARIADHPASRLHELLPWNGSSCAKPTSPPISERPDFHPTPS